MRGDLEPTNANLPVIAGVILAVYNVREVSGRERIAASLGGRLVSDPNAVPPRPPPENPARPTLAKTKTRAKRKAN